MGLYLAAAGLIAAAVAQVSVLPYLPGNSVGIDLVLLLVVAWSIIKGVHAGVLWALIGGLALDALSGGAFGVLTAALAVVALLAGVRRLQLLRGSLLGPLFAAVVGTVLYDGVVMVLLGLLGRQWEWLPEFRGTVLPAAALNALAMLPVYGLLLLAHRRREPKIKW